MKFEKNNKGLTLIEVIVSIAIISMIAVTMLNVLGSGFTNIFRSGKASKEDYKAAGELEISVNEPEYKGKYDSESIVNEEKEIKLFQGTRYEKSVETRLIKSKIGDLNSKLESEDKYFFTYTVDEELQYTEGQAFISKSNSSTDDFQPGDIPISKDLLEGKYRYNGKGRLIIPSKEALTTDTIHTINWQVKDGILIKNLEESEKIRLYTSNTEGIVLKSSNGNIELNGTIIESGGKITIEANDKLELQSTIVKSNLNNIFLEGKESVNIQGTDTQHTEISVKEETNKITIKTDGEVFKNDNTKFKYGNIIKNGPDI